MVTPTSLNGAGCAAAEPVPNASKAANAVVVSIVFMDASLVNCVDLRLTGNCNAEASRRREQAEAQTASFSDTSYAPGVCALSQHKGVHARLRGHKGVHARLRGLLGEGASMHARRNEVVS